VDTATLSGILAGFVMALGAVLLGPAPAALAHLPSLMFVLGGTCAAILLTFPATDLRQAVSAGIRAFAAKDIPAGDTVAAMVHLAEVSRKEGIMALEEIHTPNPILSKAARLVAGNADPGRIRDALDTELLALQRRHGIAIAVFSRLAACAPAMGLLGTLTGLVQTLADPKGAEAFGPGIAVALPATVYGCLLSALVFLPVAGKLTFRRMQAELRLNIIFEGTRYILENNNPGLIHERLSSFLSLKERSSAH
jgi:chemotaxis protein MotA